MSATKYQDVRRESQPDSAPPADGDGRQLRHWIDAAIDRQAAADPGLTQLRTATQSILGIVFAIVLVYGFVRLTGALQLPDGAAPPAVVVATNHALLIVSMLVAGIFAMMAGFVVNDPTPRQQLVSTLILPLPALGAIGIGLALGSHRVVSLIWLVVLMTGSVYVRRFGPRGFACGLVAFNGGFLGFFLHRELGLGDMGWLAADVGLGIVASLCVRFLVLRTDEERTLDRMRRSWQARIAQLLELSASAVATTAARHRQAAGDVFSGRDVRDERIRRQIVRLNESTLIIEAQLVTTSPTSARLEAQELFSAELALTNCARFATALGRVLTAADADLRDGVLGTLSAARDEHWSQAQQLARRLRARTASSDRVTTLISRFATSVEQYAASRDRLHQAIENRRRNESVATFEPAVQLNNGYLPGSVPVSAAASTTPGRGRFERTTLPPYVRTSIQIAIAATIAVVVGDAIDGFRLYWAVLAAYLAFMATTNTGEQVRKALFRVAGTAVGIVTGDLLVHATGGSIAAALPIVLVVLFLGIYLIRVNYTFMVIGITMMLSLIYYQLGEFSWHLLVLRLGETAVGVFAVVLTVLVVFPLRPQRVLTAGVLLWFRELSTLLDASLERLLGGPPRSLRRDIRGVDAAWAALEATAQPLRHATFGRNAEQLAEIRAISSAARFYVRSLGDSVMDVTTAAVPDLAPAAHDLRTSADAIATRIETGRTGVYMRAGALIDGVLRSLPRHDDSPADADVHDRADQPANGQPAKDERADDHSDDNDAAHDRTVDSHSHDTPGAHDDGADEHDDPGLVLALRDLLVLDSALARLAGALDMDVRDHDTTDLRTRP